MPQWKHNVGDCVDHISGRMPAIVLNRTKTLAGSTYYNIRLTDIENDRRDRVFREEFIDEVIAGSKKCRGCRFYVDGKCCRDFT